jgi:MFS family permease
MAARARLLVGVSVLWIPLAFLFDGVTVLVLPLRVGGDATQLGLVSFVGLAVAAGLQPVAGWLSDRYRSRLDRRAFLAVAAIPTILGLWLLAGSVGLVAATIGYLLVQVGGTAIQAAQQTLIPEHVTPAQRGRVSGLKAAFDVGGSFIAFLILGIVLASGDVLPSAVIITALILGAVGLVFAFVPPAVVAAPAPARPRPSASTLDLPTGLVPLVVARFLFLFATYAVGRFLGLLVADRLGIPPGRAVDDAGGLLALFTLITAGASIPLGWLADRRSRRDVMVGGAVVAAVGIGLLVPSAGLPGVIAGGLLMSLGTAAFITGNWAATTSLVPPTASGRLMGIANLGTGLAAAAAGLIGPLIDAVGFGPPLVLAAGASMAAVLPLVGATPVRHRTNRETAT